MADQAHKKTPFTKLRKWYGKQFKSGTRKETMDAPTEISDFLGHHADTPVAHEADRHKPRPKSDFYAGRQHTSQDGRHGNAISNTGSRQMFPVHEPNTNAQRASASFASLPSPFSFESNSSRRMNFAPQNAPPSVRPGGRSSIREPADFYRYRTDMRTESSQARPMRPTRSHQQSFIVEPTPMPAASESQTRARQQPVVDSIPIPVMSEPRVHFAGYPTKQDHEAPVKIQAYPGNVHQKQARYVPPTLQSGYIYGVPPSLQARYSTANLVQSQKTRSTADETKNYQFPLVDFHQGLFLNANMSEAHISSTRYQEPRIPNMDFPNLRLADEFSAELTRRSMPYEEKEVLARPQSRAWMSPSSPLNPSVYEMEASVPGYSLHDAKLVDAGFRMTPRVVDSQSRNSQLHRRPVSTFSSPVSPVSSDVNKVEVGNYNWRRFSDHEYVDPAEEYSRQYRLRRRKQLEELRSER